MGPIEWGPKEAIGAPDHPHRGFETVTYLLAGETEHKDSGGHQGMAEARRCSMDDGWFRS